MASFNTQKQLEKSRLGRLLVNRGYITEQQLEQALVQQRQTGVKLGEVLVASGLIDLRDLDRTLKHQKRYRYAAAFVAMAVTPLQPMVAFAASNTASATTNAHTAEETADINVLKNLPKLSDAEMSGMSGFGGMQMLDDESMAGVSAQGLFEDFAYLTESVENKEKPDSIRTLKTMANIFLPVTNFIEWDSKVEGVTYDTTKPPMEILAANKIKVSMPLHIERISLENLRVKGSGPNAPIFGHVYMSDISFSPDTSLTITTRN